MFDINLYSNIPIYQQIIDEYKKLVVKGILKNNDKIPSIRELALMLSINPSTVSKAYAQLEREGLIKTSRGRGTFISDEKFDEDVLLHEIKDQLTIPIKNAISFNIEEDKIIDIVKSIYKENNNEV